MNIVKCKVQSSAAKSFFISWLRYLKKTSVFFCKMVFLCNLQPFRYSKLTEIQQNICEIRVSAIHISVSEV
jgi:hypothetical protein